MRENSDYNDESYEQIESEHEVVEEEDIPQQNKKVTSTVNVNAVAK